MNAKVKINDIHIYYEQSGSGQIGFYLWLGVDHSMWYIRALRINFVCLCLIIAHRQTDIPDGPYSMEQFCEDTLGFVVHCKLRKRILLAFMELISLNILVQTILKWCNPYCLL